MSVPVRNVPAREIIIVGAGIVGVTTAAILSEAGHRVSVFDRKGIAEETSYGNAAALAYSDIIPMASPKIMWKAPRWLFDPLGPLSIRPTYLPHLLPWLLRFGLASRPAQVERSINAQTCLMRLAESEAMALYSRAGLMPMIRHDGSLELYESEAEFKASLHGWQRRADAGIQFTHVRGVDLADLQPGLSPRFTAGTFVPGWKTVSDPYQLACNIWQYASKLGARFKKTEVRAIEAGTRRPAVRLSSGQTVSADRIVIAAGAWSKRLLAGLTSLNIPLDTERGYNTTLPANAFSVNRQLIFGGHGFVVTPLETGLRVGGAVEFAGLDAAPNFARSQAMLEKAKDFLPGLDISGGTQWMGYRPSLPDSLPVMGLLPGHEEIVLAFGNGHLGLTQSSAMARLCADLVSGHAPSIDISPFRPDRF